MVFDRTRRRLWGWGLLQECRLTRYVLRRILAAKSIDNCEADVIFKTLERIIVQRKLGNVRG